MSYQPLWLQNVVAYSIQAAALVVVGTIMATLLRLRVPRVRLAYWQALLAACVFLPLLQPWRPEVLETTGAVLTNFIFVPEAPPPGPSLAEIVLYVIVAGIVLRALWMTLGLGRLWLYRRQAQRVEQPPEAIKEAQRLAPVFPVFFVSHQIRAPATFGFLRPKVLLPARFLEMEPAMQKAVALHELLHVERRDWMWNMFEEVVLTLLWFHLPLWWVVRSARLSREQVVDAEAVRRSRERRPYLKALLEMAGQPTLAESLPAPLFVRESQLAERVALMMKEVHMSRTRLTVSILAATVTLLISGASLVWAFPLKSPAQQPAAQFSASAQKSNGNEQKPVPIYKQQPRYTREAKVKRITGTVVLSCTIDANGNVTEVSEISKPLGEGLDESAISAVRNWKFKPAALNGVPVPAKTTITINFTLAEKPGKAYPKSTSAVDPPAQPKQSAPEVEANNGVPVKVDPAEIERQVEQAIKQSQIAQKNFAKIDQAKIQQQVEQAMKQLQKMNTPEMRLQMQKQMEQLQKMNSPEMQRRMAEMQKRLDKMNTPEARQKMQEAIKQAEKVNTPEMRKRIADAMKQAKIAEEKAAKFNQAKIQEQLKQAQLANEKINRAELERQLETAREQLRVAQEQMEQARQKLKEQRQEMQIQRKGPGPVPPATPQPPQAAPPAPQAVKPAPAAPPVPPPSGISGGVQGGVPGGITGGVPSAPATPAAVPPPPELAAPTPAVPPSPQN